MLIEFVCCGWNCENDIEKCIDSVMMQNEDEWRVHIVVDASPDNTYQRTIEYISTLPQQYQDNFSVFNREERMSALFNINDIVRNHCQEDSVIVILDFDDWLAHANVIRLLHQLYQDQNVWISWSRFVDYPEGSYGFSRPMDVGSDIRNKGNWFCGPLRAFRKKLFDHIKIEDFMNEEGEFYRTAYDVAMLLPMLEMAGAERRKFIDNVMYVYNKNTGFNDGAMHYDFCIKTQDTLFKKEPYKKLESL